MVLRDSQSIASLSLLALLRCTPSHKIRSFENVQAVIGILTGEKLLSEETRKRPRIDLRVV